MPLKTQRGCPFSPFILYKVKILHLLICLHRTVFTRIFARICFIVGQVCMSETALAV